MLERGADSAIFNIDALGNPLMIATSLKFRNSGDEGGKKWPVHGVVTAASDEKRMALYEAREAYSHIKTFFYVPSLLNSIKLMIFIMLVQSHLDYLSFKLIIIFEQFIQFCIIKDFDHLRISVTKT